MQQTSTLRTPMPWFVRGDIDGFFGLALDNFVQLLLINVLCHEVLKFPDDLLYGRVLPGAAVSVLIGNLFYSWQARQLSMQTGRRDICALPYGINTVSIFGHVFLVMLPAELVARSTGIKDDGEIARIAWQAGMIACLGSGVLECGGAFIAEKIRKATPRAALLSTLAGIALTFIAIGFLFRSFAHPIIGLSTLAIVLLIYFGRVRFRGGIPGGLVSVAAGTALCWITGVAPGHRPDHPPHLYLPIPALGDLFHALQSSQALTYISVIIPMGIFNIVGSLQNIESAEAAGDPYPTAPSLMVNGIGSVAAAFFGSCFPTTIYIGHPGWKAIGSRAGYSILNGVAVTTLCVSGTLAYISYAIPIDAGMAIVLWIGLVITAQAFQAVPREHAPAVVVGLLPGVAAWGAIMAKNGLRAAGFGETIPFSDSLIPSFLKSDTWIHGAFALEQGFIFTAMILAAATVYVIERRFRLAALWCVIAAALCLLGMMHSYEFTFGDAAFVWRPAVPWAIGYGIMAAFFFVAPWITEHGEGH